MAERDPSSIPSSPPSFDNGTRSSSTDNDALALQSMGYDPSLQRNYSRLSVLGVAFSLTNSWFGISVALIAGINSGGP